MIRSLLSSLLALALTACQHTQGTQGASAATPQPTGPALWKVADADTTIYLFGTIHALPPGTDWFNGPIATALGQSGMLVTELPNSALTDPAAQMAIGRKATLAEGTLRDLLSAEQRASYEAALTALDLPPNAFDPFEPWFAGMNLSILPLIKDGYSPESGVEIVIESKAPPAIERAALETLDAQIALFDEMPVAMQIDFLMSAAENIDTIKPAIDAMVADWLEGDADGLARLMNAGVSDPALAELLLYERNRAWAGWIDARMDAQGTVFVAVGAGHLAGERSVQDYLAQRGLTTERVQ